MAWSTPPAWAVGNVVTEAKLDIISDDLNYLHDLLATQTYTPTLTQSTNAPKTTTFARYNQSANLVIGEVKLTVSGAGATAGADIGLGLPVACITSDANCIVGVGQVYDASAGFFYYGDLVISGATTVVRLQRRADGAAASYLGSTGFTAALASSDLILAKFAYFTS